MGNGKSSSWLSLDRSWRSSDKTTRLQSSDTSISDPGQLSITSLKCLTANLLKSYFRPTRARPSCYSISSSGLWSSSGLIPSKSGVSSAATLLGRNDQRDDHASTQPCLIQFTALSSRPLVHPRSPSFWRSLGRCYRILNASSYRVAPCRSEFDKEECSTSLCASDFAMLQRTELLSQSCVAPFQLPACCFQEGMIQAAGSTSEL